MKKIFYLVLFFFIFLFLASCNLGRVIVNDNVQFSEDYQTIIYNNVSYTALTFLDLYREIKDEDILIYDQEPAPFMAAHQMIYKSSKGNSLFLYEIIGTSSDRYVSTFYLNEDVALNDLVFVDSFYNLEILLINEMFNCEDDEFYSIYEAYMNASKNQDDQTYDYYEQMINASILDIDYEKLSKLEFSLKDDLNIKFTFETIYFHNNNYYITTGLNCYKLSNNLSNIIMNYLDLN